MADTVKVSLLQSRAFRDSKSGEYIRYRRGVVEMPRAHAQAMGLTRRIVREQVTEQGTTVTRDPFAGVLDDKLVGILTAAGYNTLDDLRRATQDDLMALDGIGPAAYERIDAAIHGGAN